MKKSALATVALLAASFLLSACTFVPKVGTTETSWVRHTISHELVYLQDNVSAYRSGGSYYYFKDKKLVKVTTEFLSADKL